MAVVELSRRGAAPAAELPRWPLTALFVGFPVWWLLGIVDVVWIPVALLMALLLARCRDVRAPRGFGVYLLFLAWAAASVVTLSRASDLATFGYRLALYASGAVLFLYVFNARPRLSARYVTGCLTLWWVITVLGGYAGLLFPRTTLSTPASWLLSAQVLQNDLVNHMVVRRLAEFNPGSYLQVAPRPSAPFLYTNNWGNVYSLLLPVVICYLHLVRRERRAGWLLVLLVASLVPAFLTLNRGMFIGVGLAAAYALLRSVLLRQWRSAVLVTVLVGIAVTLFTQLPVEQRLSARLDGQAADSTSTDTRSSLYVQAVRLAEQSPVFGYGVPQQSEDPDQVPVGTQGQLWMVLVSHGPFAACCFLGWFLVALWRTWRRTDPVGLACSCTLLVGSVELLYYGVLPNGLPILMTVAALGMRAAAAPRHASRPATAPVRRIVEAAA